MRDITYDDRRRRGDAAMTRGHAHAPLNMSHGDLKPDATMEAHIAVFVLDNCITFFSAARASRRLQVTSQVSR